MSAKAKKAAQDLKDELAILRYPPGSAGRDLETWRIAERKRDEAKARAKKAKPMSQEDAEAAAVHLLKTSHGAVQALNALFLERVAGGQPDPAANEAKSSRRPRISSTPIMDGVFSRRARPGRREYR